MFPLSNWTELDVWQYIHLENIPIVPLYLAAPRPVVERDGMLIMVDDDRFPLEPGEVPEMRKVRFRTLGCYPLTGAVESQAATLTESHPGDAADHHLRAPGSSDRPRLGRVDGEEEAGGVLLMAHSPTTCIADDIEAYLASHEHKSLLRFITCGSVDDGKSTLIGRLLYESKLVFEDHLAALERDSKKVGTQGGELDFALLVDGLAAEREQGITIDVAYRFFSTEHRKFIVADTPGPRAVHPQHGHRRLHRRPGRDPHRRPQGRAHPDPAPQLPGVAARHPPRGARHQQARPGRLLPGRLRQHRGRLPRPSPTELGLNDILCIPMSALKGDNVTEPTANMPWYTGPTLIEHLETIEVDDEASPGPFRLPVQWVNRPNLDFRGFSGEIVGGSVQPGRPGARPAVGHREQRRAHRHAATATSTRRSPASRSPSPSPTRSTSAAATSSPRPTTSRRSPTSSRRTSSG